VRHLNRKQKNNEEKILKFILEYLKSNQKPPTIREIATAVGLKSTSSVSYYLKKLEKKGLLVRETGISRNLKLTAIKTDVGKSLLPVVGTVRAGEPIYAEENIETYLDLPHYFANKGDFLLRVKGDSMTDAGIFENDLLLIRQTPVILPGEIGVFLVDGEATVKEFKIINGRPALVPKNPFYTIIYPDELMVVGKVVAVLRDLENVIT
jgi:repressor LexA